MRIRGNAVKLNHHANIQTEMQKAGWKPGKT